MDEVTPPAGGGDAQAWSPAQREILRGRLQQARESLEDAVSLFMQDAQVNFVMNGLYYAFLYPVLGLLQVRGMSGLSSEQTVPVFEGIAASYGIDQEMMDAVREAFALRPACSCEGKRKATINDVERLLPCAERFVARFERMIAS